MIKIPHPIECTGGPFRKKKYHDFRHEHKGTFVFKCKRCRLTYRWQSTTGTYLVQI